MDTCSNSFHGYIPTVETGTRIRLLSESSPGQSDKEEGARLLIEEGFWLLEISRFSAKSYLKDRTQG